MTDDNNRVAILLSTFNGEKFLPQQLDSLYAQNHPNLHIFVRDDGSSDGSLAIAQRYARQKGGMTVMPGKNVGFVQSFFELLQLAGDGYDFYFFCDQDDVWHPDKVAAAVDGLLQRGLRGPGMYCSRTEYVDEQLNTLGMSPGYPDAKLGWGNALVQNVATGCTMAINAPARALLTAQLPGQCLAHDWWVYLVVSAFGEVVFDQRSHIRYRQHGSNTIGMLQGGWAGQWSRVRRFWRRSGFGFLDQLAEFLRIHGDQLEADRREQVRWLLRSRQRWQDGVRVAAMGFYWRTSLVDSLILRVLLVLKKY